MLGVSRAGALFIDPYNLKEVSLTKLCLAVAKDFLASTTLSLGDAWLMNNNYKMCYHYQTITIRLQLTFTITYWDEVETVECPRHVREVIGSTLDKA